MFMMAVKEIYRNFKKINNTKCNRLSLTIGQGTWLKLQSLSMSNSTAFRSLTLGSIYLKVASKAKIYIRVLGDGH